jgi:hypothetical protein
MNWYVLDGRAWDNPCDAMIISICESRSEAMQEKDDYGDGNRVMSERELVEHGRIIWDTVKERE